MLRLDGLELHREPFPYFLATEVLEEPIISDLLSWLEGDAPWKLVETDFYEQYEFSLQDVQLPRAIKVFVDDSFLGAMRSKFEQLFDCHLTRRVDCTAHKLVQGQRIRVHNDYIPGEETHRLLIQLNRGWSQEQGGFLMLFNSADPSDVHSVFSPLSGSALGFAISERSHHAVSTIHNGKRFTIVFSFYGASRG